MIDTALGGFNYLPSRHALPTPNSMEDFRLNQLSNNWSQGPEIARGGVSRVHHVIYRGLPSQHIIKIFTPDRNNAENQFLTHVKALSILRDNGLSNIVAPALVDYGVLGSTPVIIEKRMEKVFHTEGEFFAYIKSLTIEQRVQYLKNLAQTMSQAALCGVYPYITKGSNLFITKYGGVGILDYGRSYINNYPPSQGQTIYFDEFDTKKKENRHCAGTNSFIKHVQYLEDEGLCTVNGVGTSFQRVAGMRTIIKKHKENPIKVEELVKEVSVLHVESF
ncbi:hypothetical protein HZC27_03105 [Candidatus Roizmanbacteria bacterium]|nr:hypothetical protein [Candidatus Roizmanbacteria bacterium]